LADRWPLSGEAIGVLLVLSDRQCARQSGKQVILRVYTAYRGKRMANWVYDAGAQRFDFTEGQTSMVMPVPWDKVFLKKWTDFVRILGTAGCRV
jgi:hypothetical protein